MRVHIKGALKMHDLKLQDLKITDQIAFEHIYDEVFNTMLA